MEDLKFRKLYASEIDCRVSTVTEKGCSLLLYKDARVDQRLLDETVGPFNWQRSHELINGNLFCNVGIFVDRRGEGYGEWIWKQDVGTESYTEKEKGQASDAFKRACFNWGIGRELYTAPFIWIQAADAAIEKIGQKWTTRQRFRVDAIGYQNDSITYLKISTTKGKSKKVVYEAGDPKTLYVKNETIPDQEQVNAIPKTLSAEYLKEHPDEPITDEECAYLKMVAEEAGVTEEQICSAYKTETLAQMKRAAVIALLSGNYWKAIKKKAVTT